MPRINKTYTLEVTVEQFLNACSPLELQELRLLIHSPQYEARMHQRPPTDIAQQTAVLRE